MAGDEEPALQVGGPAAVWRGVVAGEGGRSAIVLVLATWRNPGGLEAIGPGQAKSRAPVAGAGNAIRLTSRIAVARNRARRHLFESIEAIDNGCRPPCG